MSVFGVWPFTSATYWAQPGEIEEGTMRQTLPAVPARRPAARVTGLLVEGAQQLTSKLEEEEKENEELTGIAIARQKEIERLEKELSDCHKSSAAPRTPAPVPYWKKAWETPVTPQLQRKPASHI
jgi:hypothetical protein